jgi:lipopolysaccharide/colanic/teichoic acid biosynthesis glycosyltransferase
LDGRRENQGIGNLACLGASKKIDLQLNQVIDAVLRVLSLWAAHTIRWFIRESFPIVPAIVLLVPLMLIVALLIRVTSPGPAIFTQRRCGKHGEPFKMFKFRSMYSDAEQRRHELEEYNQMSGPVFKLDDDPRITLLGRWLRRYSIDELPQLFNVLGGQMSLVGPRPLPTYEVENFANPAQRRRLSVKPGITCLWQISGRNEVRDFETWVKLDLDYIDNWSIWLDFQILALTLPVVLSGSGAR